MVTWTTQPFVMRWKERLSIVMDLNRNSEIRFISILFCTCIIGVS